MWCSVGVDTERVGLCGHAHAGQSAPTTVDALFGNQLGGMVPGGGQPCLQPCPGLCDELMHRVAMVTDGG